MYRVIIYESSSFGGCFKYSLQLLKAFKSDLRVKNAKLYLPSNATIQETGIKKVLLSDDRRIKIKTFKKIDFILRQLINPFVFLYCLYKEESSLVIFNDFEQSTSPIWTFFYKMLLKKHKFGVYLHDPNRDDYPPSYRYSRFSMRSLMSLMSFACYHEYLPNKEYYDSTQLNFISVPHGVYPAVDADKKLTEFLLKRKGEEKLIGMLGNIRNEKNYELSIKALKQQPNVKLLVAGKEASSEVDVSVMKQLAIKLKVSDQIIWLTNYLTEEEMASCILCCDYILLNYSKSFTSQSAVLNDLAHYKKNILASETESGLTRMIKKYNLGDLIKADSQTDLDRVFKDISSVKDDVANWNDYIKYASWENNVSIVLNEYEKLN